MVLVFDLDDTLYDETTYVKSGFMAVAKFMSNQCGAKEESIYHDLIKELDNGRGKIFDVVLKKHICYSKMMVKKCISAYRLHQPNITLPKISIECLNRFKNYPKYIVTDGNKIVQQNKIKALKIDSMVNFHYITHRYGVHNSKPSPYCFMRICEREKVAPNQVVYIADNICKDFVGIKPLGFKTIQVMTGQYKDLKKERKYRADIKIKSLDELTVQLLATI